MLFQHNCRERNQSNIDRQGAETAEAAGQDDDRQGDQAPDNGGRC